MHCRSAYARVWLLVALFGASASAQNTPTSFTLVSVISGQNGGPPSTNPAIYGIGYGCCASGSGDAYSEETLPSGQVETIALQMGNAFIDLSSVSYTAGTGQPFVFTFNLTNGDHLVLTDASPNYHNNLGSGTARVTYGIGLFNGATGSFGYTVKCQLHCETVAGMLVAPNIAFELTGSGTLYLPAPAVGLEKVRTTVNAANADAAVATVGGNLMVRVHQALSNHLRAQDVSRDASSNGPSFNMSVQPQPVPTNYSVTATCSNPATDCWVTIPTASGTIQALTTSTVSANLNLTGFPAGSYPASVNLTLTPQTSPPQPPTTLNYPITLLVDPPNPVLQLSQAGVTLLVADGAPTSGSYPITITNSGQEPMPFEVTPVVLKGGGWLTVSPPSGTVAPGSSQTLNVLALTAGMDEGRYFGQLDFTANGAFNSPQSMYVVLQITGDSPPAIFPSGVDLVFPSGVKFTAGVDVTNPSDQPVGVSVSAEADQSSPWLTIANGSFQLDGGGGAAAPLLINTTGLSPGLYHGTINVLFSTSNGEPTQIPVKLVINPAAPPPTSSAARAHELGSCNPTQLVPVFTAVGNGFPVVIGLPVAIQVQVMDDCGNPLNSGFVGVTLDSGDPAFALTSVGNGAWTGTWMPHNLAGGSATVTVTATSFVPALQGTVDISGVLVANPNLPLVSSGGVVSAASLALNAPIAPGSYISIFGTNFASAAASAQSLPLTTNLGGIQVTLGGEPLPLQYAGPGQINAVVPYDAAVNSTAQVVVEQNGTAYSMPETVLLAAAQPAVFTQNGSGTGAGAIEVATPSGSQFLNTPSTPATAGDALIIYCTGLGAVSPAIPAGSAAPASPLSRTTSTVTVSIGGKPAQVLFAGLAPGYTGLYQVNADVPPGIPPDAQVPVVLSVAGASSPPVTVAIQ